MRKAFFLFLSLFVIFFGVIIIKITDVKRQDVLEYEKLLRSSHGKSMKFSLSHLYRKNVVKEIWWGERKKPLYARIECARSELIATQGTENLGAVEKMEDVKSLYQEKFFYQMPDGRIGYENEEGKIIFKDENPQEAKTFFPMQDVRYFEATSGVCGYRNWDFVGENVIMKKYRVHGHLPPSFLSLTKEALSTAEGKKMHFQLREKGITIQLDGLKTTFNPKEGV